jgi:chaperonin GroES
MEQVEKVDPFVQMFGFAANPSYDRLIIKPDNAETKTKSGIIIPDTAQEKPRKGLVIAAGPGNGDGHVMIGYPGARIVFGKYAGSDIKINDTDLIIMRDNDIMFVYPEGAEFSLTV